MCANGFVRFARYCGKMYSHHLFLYGGLFGDSRNTIVKYEYYRDVICMCANGFVRFARYCGKMYSHHLFLYGGLFGDSRNTIVKNLHGLRENLTYLGRDLSSSLSGSL